MTAINNGIFPHNLKLADIVPAFKKKDPLNPNIYRHIKLLLIISKVFEKILYTQMYIYMENKLSVYLCGSEKAIAHSIV